MPELLTLDFSEGWQAFERGQTCEQLEQKVLPTYLSEQRWFASKGSQIIRTELRSRFVLSGRSGDWLLATFRAHLAGGRSEDYFVPLAVIWDEQLRDLSKTDSDQILANVRRGDRTGALQEALGDSRFIADIVRAAGDQVTLVGPDGSLSFRQTRSYVHLQEEDEQNIRKLGAEQSNSSILIAKKMILKAFRKLECGIQPELEMGRYLTEVAGYQNTPPLLASVEHLGNNGQPTALVVIQGFIPNEGDAWSFTLNHLKRFFDTTFAAENGNTVISANANLSAHLGLRIAELHRAFAIEGGDPAFQPEPVTSADVAGWQKQIQSEAETTFGLLASSESVLPPEQYKRVHSLLDQRQRIVDLISSFKLGPGSNLKKTRFHGDLHLGQVLVAGNDFYIIDFEGEPARPFVQRRTKNSPLKDVAGMLRSFNYAAWSALFESAAGDKEKIMRLEKPAIAWQDKASSALLRAYKQTIGNCPSCPADPIVFRQLLDLLVLEKALYEIRYELANRPSWLRIPVEGVLSLLESPRSA